MYSEDRTGEEKLVGGRFCVVQVAVYKYIVCMQVDHCEESLMESESESFHALADCKAGPVDQEMLLRFHTTVRDTVRRNHRRRISTEKVL